MWVYILCIIALLIAIRYEKFLNSPCMDKALDELEESGFEFGDHQWCGCDNMSALAIDRNKEKLCLVRAYKGWQQVDFDDLVEFELEDKKSKPKRKGIRRLFISKADEDCQVVAVNIIINNLDCFNFSLKIYHGCHPEKLKKARKEAQEIVTILKLLKITCEKKQLKQLQAIGRPVRSAVRPSKQVF